MDASGQMGNLIYFLLYVLLGPFVVGAIFWRIAAQRFRLGLTSRLLFGASAGGLVVGIPVAFTISLDVFSILVGFFFVGLAFVVVWFFLLYLEGRIGDQLP